MNVKKQNPPLIMISAGEASGDLHGAHLIQSVLIKNSDITFKGMGGNSMANAGCELIVDCKKLAIIDLIEIFTRAKDIWRAMKIMRQSLKTLRPNLLVLIDFSGFNLRLARFAHKLGIKILYYVSPQVWAWRVHRVEKIKRYVNQMAVIYPFEVDFYQKRQVPALYVGNPVAHKIKMDLNPLELKKSLGLNLDKKTIGLVPGSRRGEINRNLPTILKAAELLLKTHPELQFVLPLASSLQEADLKEHLAQSNLPITITRNRVDETIPACDAVIAVSGTVTLEIGLLTIPMVIIYKLTPISFQIGKRVIKVDHIGICNLIAGKRVVQELIQFQATPEAIHDEIHKILSNDAYRNQMVEELNQMKHKLLSVPTQNNIAQLVLNLI
ncbi:MAG: lipid-A-disaccharide synthase [Gammaproteobacteria bacterium]